MDIGKMQWSCISLLFIIRTLFLHTLWAALCETVSTACLSAVVFILTTASTPTGILLTNIHCCHGNKVGFSVSDSLCTITENVLVFAWLPSLSVIPMFHPFHFFFLFGRCDKRHEAESWLVWRMAPQMSVPPFTSDCACNCTSVNWGTFHLILISAVF